MEDFVYNIQNLKQDGSKIYFRNILDIDLIYKIYASNIVDDR